MITENLTITEELSGIRLDKSLKKTFPLCSRTYIQYLISQSAVLLNGKAIKKREVSKVGDRLEICFLPTEEICLEPEAIKLDILYEDDDILVVNKEAGMVIHPAPGNHSGTFVNALLHHCSSLEGDGVRPGIVHRLDKDTSGVIVAAKTKLAHQRLIEQFASRTVAKSYLAVTAARPCAESIDEPIGRHPIKRKEMTISTKGRSAQTFFTVIDRHEDVFLIECKPITGRTHQIRVHLKALKAPIIGDMVYGSSSLNKKLGVEKQLLHAHSLTIHHPISGKQMKFSAPLPERMTTFFPKREIKTSL